MNWSGDQLAGLLRRRLEGSANQGARRYALLIGIGEYQHLQSLRNPPSDVDAIERRLSDLGFHCVRAATEDGSCSSRCFEEGLQEFCRCITEQGYLEDDEKQIVSSRHFAHDILIHYSGHGLQWGDENFLVMSDFDPGAEQRDGLFPLDKLLRQIRDLAQNKFVLLDACRDPGGLREGFEELNRNVTGSGPVERLQDFAKGVSRQLIRKDNGAVVRAPGLGRSGVAGAAGMDSTFIAFSTEPGDVALDGAGNISPFSGAFAEHVDVRGLDIFALSQRVSFAVRNQTREDGDDWAWSQVPWSRSNIAKPYYFNPNSDRPLWILAALGTLAGVANFFIAFDNFGSLESTTGRLRDVWCEPVYLVSSAIFGVVLGLAAFIWGTPHHGYAGRRKPRIGLAVAVPVITVVLWIFARGVAKQFQLNAFKDQLENPYVVAAGVIASLSLAIWVFRYRSGKVWVQDWAFNRWLVLIGVALIYTAIAAISRLWFESGNPHKIYDVVGGDSLFNLGGEAVAKLHSTILLTVLPLMLAGAASVLSGALFVRELYDLKRIALGALIGALGCLLFLIVLHLLGTYPETQAQSGGNGRLELSYRALISIFLVLWHVLLGLNVGLGYAKYRPPLSDGPIHMKAKEK